MKNLRKILIVGQTPPPFHGQAISTETLLKGNYSKVKLYLVRLSFSSSIDQVGRVNLYKIFHLFGVIFRIYLFRILYGVKTLYFMPVGNKTVPFIRDTVILLTSRWLFSKTIFHFRVGGLKSFYLDLPYILKLIFRKIYFRADLAIKLSDTGTGDDECFMAKRIAIVPNGIKDYYLSYGSQSINKDPVPTILYVGAIMESKGIYTILETCKILKDESIVFKCRIIGEFSSLKLKKWVHEKIKEFGIESHLIFGGMKTNEDKWMEYMRAHLFFFPSHHETFGRVLLEAMSFRLPIVASDTGGIPTIVENGISGFLIPVRHSDIFAEKIKILLNDPRLAHEMGNIGRQIFIQKFSEEIYLRNMEKVFSSEYGNPL